MKSMSSLAHSLQVEGQVAIDVALVPSSANSWQPSSLWSRYNSIIHENEEMKRIILRLLDH